MSTRKNPSYSTIFAFCLLLSVATFAVYRWVKGPTIYADEVRLYHRRTSGEPAPQMLLHLRGDAAQSAASNFVFTADGAYYECLDGGGWYHVVFLDNNHVVNSYDFYVHNGQLDSSAGSTTSHLTQSSRLYWERLIQKAN